MRQFVGIRFAARWAADSHQWPFASAKGAPQEALRTLGAVRSAATGNPRRPPAIWAIALWVGPQRRNFHAGEVLDVNSKKRATEVIFGKRPISRPTHLKPRGGNRFRFLTAPFCLLGQGGWSVLSDEAQGDLGWSKQRVHVSNEVSAKGLRRVNRCKGDGIRGLSAKQPCGKVQRTRCGLAGRRKRFSAFSAAMKCQCERRLRRANAGAVHQSLRDTNADGGIVPTACSRCRGSWIRRSPVPPRCPCRRGR